MTLQQILHLQDAKSLREFLLEAAPPPPQKHLKNMMRCPTISSSRQELPIRYARRVQLIEVPEICFGLRFRACHGTVHKLSSSPDAAVCNLCITIARQQQNNVSAKHLDTVDL